MHISPLNSIVANTFCMQRLIFTKQICEGKREEYIRFGENTTLLVKVGPKCSLLVEGAHLSGAIQSSRKYLFTLSSSRIPDNSERDNFLLIRAFEPRATVDFNT